MGLYFRQKQDLATTDKIAQEVLEDLALDVLKKFERNIWIISSGFPKQKNTTWLREVWQGYCTPMRKVVG